MTRTEAKKRWCPQAISLIGTGWVRGGANRHPDAEIVEACMCVADRCMAWREWETEPSSGHCGLAGDKGAP